MQTVKHQRHPQQRQRQLDEVLRDPKASWGEIREAMKSSRGCTNVAIIGAIASGRGVTFTPGSDVKGDKSADSGIGADADDEPSSGREVKKPLTHDNVAPVPESPNDVTNSRSRRPSRRGTRRGTSRPGLKSSIQRSQRRRQQTGGKLRGSASDSDLECSVNASINMMDFGVAVNINRVDFSDGETPTAIQSHNSSSSCLDGLLSRMEGCSGTSVDSDESIGWDHGGCFDMHSSIQSSGDQSNYSDLVDSSGFLDWDSTRCAQPDASVSISMGKVKSDGLLSRGTQSDAGDLAGSSGNVEWDREDQDKKNTQTDSFVPTRISKVLNGLASEVGNRPFSASTNSYLKPTFRQKKEQWNIEDYEDARDNMMYTKFRPSSHQNVTPVKKEEIKMDEIKEALRKVSYGSGKGCSLSPDPRSIDKRSHEENTNTSKPSRRQSVTGVPRFLNSGNGESYRRLRSYGDAGSQSLSSSSEISRSVRRQHTPFTEDPSKPAHRKSENGIMPPSYAERLRSTFRHSSFGASFFASSDEANGDNNIWNEGPQRSRSHDHVDLREAIRIKRND